MTKIDLLKTSFALILMLALVGIVNAATVTTDKKNYEPEETVLISGEGFAKNTPLAVTVTRPNGEVESCDVSSCDSMFLGGRLTSDSNGAFSNYQYKLDGMEGEYFVKVFDETNSAQATFTDYRYIESVKLNGNDKVTVSPGGSITVTMKVKIDGIDNNWRSTKYKIEGEGELCKDTPDYTIGGTYTETFTITAPANPGVYDIEFTAYDGGECSGDTSWPYPLQDSITVTPGGAPEPVIAIAVIAALAPVAGYGFIVIRKKQN